MEHADERLRAAGLRVTRPRLAILAEVSVHPHADVESIATGDNHHHLVCRACGDIVDVPCATGKAPCLQASEAAGYLIDEAEVTYWGVCANCQGIHQPQPATNQTIASTTHRVEEKIR